MGVVQRQLASGRLLGDLGNLLHAHTHNTHMRRTVALVALSFLPLCP